MSHIGTAMMIRFGQGQVGLAIGTFNEEHAVFLSALDHAGVMGEVAYGSRDNLLDGDIVLLFPTEDQAKAVHAAMGAQPPRG